MRQFSLLIKPSGGDCNLDCGYWFYKDRPGEILIAGQSADWFGLAYFAYLFQYDRGFLLTE